jgi:hypothetical protein
VQVTAQSSRTLTGAHNLLKQAAISLSTYW